MKRFFKSWKTSLTGLAIIALKLLAAHGKIDANDLPVLVAGIGLIAAKDHNVTGGNSHE